jgi:hypothetical protein
MSKLMAEVKIEGQLYSIRATAHALTRMAERGVEAHAVCGTVLALGPERIHSLQEAHEEAIVIDEVANCAVVVAFAGNRIMVVTVINRSNVWVKSATRVERI